LQSRTIHGGPPEYARRPRNTLTSVGGSPERSGRPRIPGRPGPSALWADVLVHPEQVVRIVLGLDLREAIVIRTIRTGAHPVGAGLVLGHEVDVHAAGSVAPRVVEQLPSPGDAGLILGRISPARMHVQGPVDLAVRIRGRIDRL